MTMISNSIEETIEVGAVLGRALRKGDVVALVGTLGSGKTILTKGIAKGLGLKDVRYVNSPSFVIIKEYKGKISLYHLDLYRLDKSTLLDTESYEEYLYGNGVTVIEWAERLSSTLPSDYLEMRFAHKTTNQRAISAIAHGPRSHELLTQLVNRP